MAGYDGNHDECLAERKIIRSEHFDRAYRMRCTTPALTIALIDTAKEPPDQFRTRSAPISATPQKPRHPTSPAPSLLLHSAEIRGFVRSPRATSTSPLHTSSPGSGCRSLPTRNGLAWVRDRMALGGEKLGRRLCMWVAMGWIIVGAILQCTSYSVAQIMVARYITGIGTGIETSTVPMYQSELCDADKRGRIVSSEPLFVGVGIVIAYFFDYGMRYVGGPVAWLIFAFLVIFLVFGVPESPRWLYYHGRNEEAMQVMCDVWDSPLDGEKVVQMQTEILDTIALEKKHGE
ncbi:hypothetical protein LTR53_007463 [Teratosphaeriaceae sp. CCFEE 6253]|nr:hypothetical protein LTR53_007463 [Teratosphaeriaceae sp. CCFEE 6253]